MPEKSIPNLSRDILSSDPYLMLMMQPFYEEAIYEGEVVPV